MRCGCFCPQVVAVVALTADGHARARRRAGDRRQVVVGGGTGRQRSRGRAPPTVVLDHQQRMRRAGGARVTAQPPQLLRHAGQPPSPTYAETSPEAEAARQPRLPLRPTPIHEAWDVSARSRLRSRCCFASGGDRAAAGDALPRRRQSRNLARQPSGSHLRSEPAQPVRMGHDLGPTRDYPALRAAQADSLRLLDLTSVFGASHRYATLRGCPTKSATRPRFRDLAPQHVIDTIRAPAGTA